MAKEIEKYAHPEYLKNLPSYTKIRDCFDGERAVKAKHVAYLPRLKAQSSEDYINYLTRALFFPITGKTVSSMVGLATTKPPKTLYPPELAPYFNDDKGGYQFTETYTSIFTEVGLMGRFGVLIDGPVGREGLPTLAPYIAENIVNWGFDDEGNLNFLLLREFKAVKGADRFETKFDCTLRHCFVSGGVYQVETLNEELEVVKGAVAPLFEGRTIDFIPWTPFGAFGVHMNVDKPPMLDIATLNLSHYLSSADLEWGRHMVGLPTPVVSGVDSSTTLSVGGTAAWILPVVEAKAYFLEFTGQGLKTLETALTDKIGLMASLSARLIDNSTRGSEAAETVRLRYVSESASLVHIIGAVESGLTVMYNMLSQLMRASGDVQIKFSREILGIGITLKEMEVLFKAYLNGETSKETLVYNLRRLDALDPNRTDEQELAAIKVPPPLPDPNKAPAVAGKG